MIPEGWKVVRLGDLESEGKLRFRTGFAQGAYNIAGNGVPQLRPFNVTERGTIDLSEMKFVQEPAPGSTYWVKPQDIIFNNTNSQELVGKTALFGIEGKFVLSNHMTFIRCDERQIDSAWLSWMLFHLWSRGLFAAICRRYVNQANVGLARLRGVSVLLPPLEEQRAIAGVLSTIQRAIEATDKVIAATRKLKASLMRHLFTYGPVPVTEADTVELQETEIGQVPARWRTCTFAEAVTIRSGQVDPKAEPYRSMTHVGPENIEPDSGRIVGAKTAGELNLISGKYLFTPQDVLYSKIRPYLRKAALPTSEGICSADMYALRPRDAVITREYLFYTLLSPAFTQQAISHQARTGIPKINREQLGSITIALPSVADQHAITNALSAADAKEECERRCRDSLQKLYESALRLLMTGQVRAEELAS
jgi:type I restriction enzyme S subunit